jgi:ribose 5-phosphate isomerase A
MNPKKAAAEKAVENIKNGMTIGLGTGSTANWAIRKIGERVKQEGLKIKAVATSTQSETLALELGITIIPFAEASTIDLTIDGADEVDSEGNLLKGGGGALLREKVVAFHSGALHVVVDEGKMVERLGKFPLPVEIIPFAHELTLKKIQRLAKSVKLRSAGDQLFVTDNGNLIADGDFFPIVNPTELDRELRSIPGVVETGIFLNNMVTTVTVSDDQENIRVIQISRK